MRPEVDMELQAVLTRELQRTWYSENMHAFRSAMRPGTMELCDLDRTLAKWHPERRTFVFSRGFVLTQPWSAVTEVLRHEMAHQYVYEVLKVTDETAHGPAFQKVCRERAIDGRASGLPNTPVDGEHGRVIRRIQKLLALGQSPNENEARAALNAAQRMMLDHNIAWARTAQQEDYGFRQVGGVRRRVPGWRKMLGSILAEHFFVRPVWVWSFSLAEMRRGKVLEISGTAANLEIAAYVHEYLIQAAARLWKAYRKEHGPQDRGEADRYRLGLMLGFRDKLMAQKRAQEETGLVWVRDASLDDYVERRYTALRSSGPVRYTQTEGYARGRSDGRSLELRAGVGKASPRAITDGRGR